MRLQAILICIAGDLTIILLFWETFLTLLGEGDWFILLEQQLETASNMSKMRQGRQSCHKRVPKACKPGQSLHRHSLLDSKGLANKKEILGSIM